MAFTTGPDFLTGILGAQNSGNVFDGNNTNTATRYGERANFMFLINKR